MSCGYELLTRRTHDRDRRQQRLRLRWLPEPGEEQPALHHPETQPTHDDDRDDDNCRLNKLGQLLFPDSNNDSESWFVQP